MYVGDVALLERLPPHKELHQTCDLMHLSSKQIDDRSLVLKMPWFGMALSSSLLRIVIVVAPYALLLLLLHIVVIAPACHCYCPYVSLLLLPLHIVVIIAPAHCC